MKEMTLSEIQSVNLEMMKDIHSFCVGHGIHYSLAYGSLIGAIRHQGFIPWDDDIDIWMPRPDFERFSIEYKSNIGCQLCSVYDKNTYINYTRVYDNNTIVICPAKANRNKIGVWIDIFPIDGISNDSVIYKEQFQRLRRYTLRVMQWRKLLFAAGCKTDIFRKIIRYFRLYRFMFTNKGRFSKWHQEIINICKEYPFGSTKKCSSLVCIEANRDDKQEIFDTEDFKHFQLKSFENQEFYVSSNYDKILITIFGDYMQIPPKEKQVSHVIKHWKFYWR